MTDLRVALTFDAEHPSRSQCPRGVAEAILETLAAHRVRGTFFVEGRWASAYPDLARSIAKAGHLVGNHSNAHVRITRLSRHGLAAEIEDAQKRIEQVTGIDPRPWFRSPYGDGAADLDVLAVLAEHGYRNVLWDIAASDWEDDRTAEGIENDVVDGVLNRGDGTTVLLHAWPAPTAGALPQILERLWSAGARFLTVAELAESSSSSL